MSVWDFRLKFLGEMIPHVLRLLAQWPAGWKKEGGTNREREGKKAMGKKTNKHTSWQYMPDTVLPYSWSV